MLVVALLPKAVPVELDPDLPPRSPPTRWWGISAWKVNATRGRIYRDKERKLGDGMTAQDSRIAVWFFQEPPRQELHLRRGETWTVAVLRDNETIGNPAPRACSSSEHLWRGVAWVSFHLRSRGNRRWHVVCVPADLDAPESFERSATRTRWFAHRDDACWHALQISRELARESGRKLADPRRAPVALRIPLRAWAHGVVLGIGFVVILQLLVAIVFGVKMQDSIPLADIVVGAAVGAWLTAAARCKWLARQRHRAVSQLADYRAAFPDRDGE